MDAKNIFSLFVALVMVGSIVGFTAFYNFPDDDSDEPIGPNSAPTALDFSAEGVEASVQELLPSINVQAETTETDVLAVNSSIYAIEGVKRVNGRFEQMPYTTLGTGYIFVGDISFDPKLGSDYIMQALERKTSLQYVNGYKYALVKIPETVSFNSADLALGLSKDHTFAENVSEALISLDSEVGDILEVSLSAVFVGTDVTNLMAFEETNLTAEPVEKKLGLEALIDSLESTLIFSAEIPFSLAEEFGAIESDVNSVQGIESAAVYLPVSKPNIFLEFDIMLDGESLSSLQSFAEGLSGTFESQDELNALVSFEEGITVEDFLGKKAELEGKLQELEISAVLSEETGFLSGQAGLTSENSGFAGNAVKKLFESRGIALELQQPGQLSISEIPDSETGPFEVESGLVPAMLFPGHRVGDLVNVEVEYALVRNKLQFALAFES